MSFELLQLGNYVTNVEKFQEEYQPVEIKISDGKSLVEQIARDVEKMTKAKIDAIKVRF